MDRFRFTAEDSIAAIQAAGGVAVLAHPFTLKLGHDALRTMVGDLVKVGLAGIEVYYSEHGPDLVQQYLHLTQEFGLLATGGSDFHGASNPDVAMGRGFGQLRVADELADALVARIAAAKR